MTHTYNISGMTCKGCVAKAKSELLKLGDILEADIQLAPPQATLTMQKHISTATLQTALNKAGNYVITEDGSSNHHSITTSEPISWYKTYKPLLIIAAYITGITLLTATTGKNLDILKGMQYFMAGFFLVFSFFKLLDLKGFADSYAMYDIIAKRWYAWGFIYAFTELALGLAFLVGFEPMLTNSITFIVMLVSIVGVLQSIFRKQKIQCACLGAIFNLPMSAVTVIEDALMIAMSGAMLIVMAQ